MFKAVFDELLVKTLAIVLITAGSRFLGVFFQKKFYGKQVFSDSGSWFVGLLIVLWVMFFVFSIWDLFYGFQTEGLIALSILLLLAGALLYLAVYDRRRRAGENKTGDAGDASSADPNRDENE